MKGPKRTERAEDNAKNENNPKNEGNRNIIYSDSVPVVVYRC